MPSLAPNQQSGEMPITGPPEIKGGVQGVTKTKWLFMRGHEWNSFALSLDPSLPSPETKRNFSQRAEVKERTENVTEDKLSET